MKILESNAQILHIVSRRSTIADVTIKILLALLFVFMGTICLFYDKISTLECHRTSEDKIECVAFHIDTFDNKKSEKIYGSLQAAELLRNSLKGGGGTYVNLILKEELYIHKYIPILFSNPKDIVNRLNNFIKDTQANNIKIEENRGSSVIFLSIFIFVIAGGLILYSIFYILFTPNEINCKFDRELDRVSIDRKYLLWYEKCLYSKHQEISPLSKIQKVGLTKTDTDDEVEYFEIVITLEDGVKYAISISDELKSHEETVKAIDNFLAIAKPEI